MTLSFPSELLTPSGMRLKSELWITVVFDAQGLKFRYAENTILKLGGSVGCYGVKLLGCLFS